MVYCGIDMTAKQWVAHAGENLGYGHIGWRFRLSNLHVLLLKLATEKSDNYPIGNIKRIKTWGGGKV